MFRMPKSSISGWPLVLQTCNTSSIASECVAHSKPGTSLDVSVLSSSTKARMALIPADAHWYCCCAERRIVPSPARPSSITNKQVPKSLPHVRFLPRFGLYCTQPANPDEHMSEVESLNHLGGLQNIYPNEDGSSQGWQLQQHLQPCWVVPSPFRQELYKTLASLLVLVVFSADRQINEHAHPLQGLGLQQLGLSVDDVPRYCSINAFPAFQADKSVEVCAL